MSQTSQTTSRPRVGRNAAGRIGSAGSAPAPPRRRRPALTALAVLLIVGGAALAGTLALRMDSRHPVLVFKQDAPVGAQLNASMFAQADVASDGLRLVGVDSLDQVRGLYLRQTAYAGQLLDTTMLSRKSPIASDQAQVGIPLTAGKVPPDLRIGDKITLMSTGDEQTPGKVLCTGLILEVHQGEKGGLGSSGAAAVATVLIPRGASAAVVSAAGSDTLGAALLERGVSLDKASLSQGGAG